MTYKNSVHWSLGENLFLEIDWLYFIASKDRKKYKKDIFDIKAVIKDKCN